jgi:hypothetical protein
MIAAGVRPQIAGQRLHRATSRAAQVSTAARGHQWNIGCTERPIMMAHDVLPPVLSREVIVVDGSKVRPGIDAARMRRDPVRIRWGWPRRGRALRAGDGRGPR